MWIGFGVARIGCGRKRQFVRIGFGRRNKFVRFWVGGISSYGLVFGRRKQFVRIGFGRGHQFVRIGLGGGINACGLVLGGGIISCGLVLGGGISSHGLALGGGINACGLISGNSTRFDLILEKGNQFAWIGQIGSGRRNRFVPIGFGRRKQFLRIDGGNQFVWEESIRADCSLKHDHFRTAGGGKSIRADCLREGTDASWIRVSSWTLCRMFRLCVDCWKV